MTTLKLAYTSDCVLGDSITSANYGHEVCSSEFGPSWRWIEFHEENAWSAKGEWETPVGAGKRAWVWINDSNGNCWESPHGMTWYRPEGESCGASCSPDIGLEGPEYSPLPGKCDPYNGDTPCAFCRPILCVSG